MCRAAAVPPSRRTVAMAATHGVYSETNARKARALAVVNIAETFAAPASCASVETTFSLAMNPQATAVAQRQSPKPSGANSGAMTPPRAASRLCWASVARLSEVSNAWRNHTRMDATKMTVNAFFTNPLALSHTSRATPRGEGRR